MLSDITLIHPRSQFLLDERVFPPLSLMYLSASLKLTGFSVQCIDMGLGTTLKKIDSKIVGISFTTSQKEEAYEIVTQLKEQGKTLIAGGAHPTHMPNECLKKGFDYMIRGEADYSLPSFLSHSNKKDKIITGLEPTSLDCLPFPDRDCLPIRSYHYLIDDEPATTIITSRSCLYNCAYCAKISNKFRTQSAYRTVNEIRHINEVYGFKAFMIFDDTFAMDEKRLKEMTWLLKGKDFKFRCFGRANLLTRDICALLKEMNVVEVGVGIESGSDKILKVNKKRTTVSQNILAVRNLHDFGIRTKAFMIIGLPGETERTIQETRLWMDVAKPDDVDFSIFQAMPGSDIFKNPDKYDIQIDYGDFPIWYKGGGLKYQAHSHTKELTAKQIVIYRNELEEMYKNKAKLK